MSNQAIQAMKDWGKLVAAVLTSTPPETTDLICIFDRNDLQLELLDEAASLWSQLRSWISINGLQKYEATDGSWGCPEWSEILEKGGVPRERLIPIEPARHSGEEAERFVALCRENGWREVTVMAPPYYLPRCFLTILGVALEQGVSLSIHCRTVPVIRWEECTTKHAVKGGVVVKGMRFDHLGDELDRILDYRARYEKREPGISAIASIAQGLEHLRKR